MAEYQDEVKHISEDTTGVVIADYVIKGTRYFDVRIDDHIKYGTPATNWVTVRAVSE
jgi:hypothetical protein